METIEGLGSNDPNIVSQMPTFFDPSFHGSEVSPDAKSHALSRAERRKLKDQASLPNRHGRLPEIAEVSYHHQEPVILIGDAACEPSFISLPLSETRRWLANEPISQ